MGAVTRGRWVTCWHNESPGVRVRVWVPWWRRPKRFATTGQMTSSRHPMTYLSGLPWLRVQGRGDQP